MVYVHYGLGKISTSNFHSSFSVSNSQILSLIIKNILITRYYMTGWFCGCRTSYIVQTGIFSWGMKWGLKFSPNCSDTYVPTRYIRYTSLQVSKLSYVVGSTIYSMRFRSPRSSSSKLMRKCFIDNWISSFALRHYRSRGFFYSIMYVRRRMIVGGIPKVLVKSK